LYLDGERANDIHIIIPKSHSPYSLLSPTHSTSPST
jgi:hypothetical protein